MEEKKLYIQTLGCQMNVQDAQKMAFLMKESGYIMTDNPGDADLIVINTCSVREKADQKAYSLIGRFRELKEEKPELIIGVAGCLAQQQGDHFFKMFPCLDMVVGTNQIDRLPAIVSSVERSRLRFADTAFSNYVRSLDIPAQPLAGEVSSFVTIMQGCNNFCAYCVVPFLRGREQSRPLADIVKEVEELMGQGIQEVTLLGQNVNSYGKTLPDKPDFAKLLQAIGNIPGIRRIRFTTSHPKDLSEGLIAAFGNVSALCEHIHLPLQAGSNHILRLMKRGYTVEDYKEKVAALRKAVPGISITSDIIVGFPGEEDDDFEQTLQVMRDVRFDNLFSFQYSKREHTPAVALEGHLAERIKRERLKTLQKLQEGHTLEKNLALIGKSEEILVEGRSRKTGSEMMGRTRTNRIVNFPGNPELLGKAVRVRIVDAYLHSLRGEME
ncbi:MAG: tRNA (N6-isopentenyl adenosine(37)-C2)-methylthiotransferase MiaB [Syntrophales bacterium]